MASSLKRVFTPEARELTSERGFLTKGNFGSATEGLKFGEDRGEIYFRKPNPPDQITPETVHQNLTFQQSSFLYARIHVQTCVRDAIAI